MLRGALCPSAPPPHASCLELPPSPCLSSSGSCTECFHPGPEPRCPGLLWLSAHADTGPGGEHARSPCAGSEPQNACATVQGSALTPPSPSRSSGPLRGCLSPAITVVLDWPQMSKLSDPGPWARQSTAHFHQTSVHSHTHAHLGRGMRRLLASPGPSAQPLGLWVASSQNHRVGDGDGKSPPWKCARHQP